MRRIFVFVLGVTFCIGARAAKPRAYDIAADLELCRASYRADRARAFKRLEEPREILNRLEREGRPHHCARQIWGELRWIAKASVRFDLFEARRSDLYRALRADPGEDVPGAHDGMWGRCAREPFMKLQETVFHLKRLRAENRVPVFTPTFLDSINSPEKLRAVFEELLISDIPATCLDRRDELNSAVTDLSRVIFRRMPANYPFHPELAQALRDYLDERWQNPETGFWGAWYRDREGRLIKTDDLSITFHLVSYYDGQVKRWPRLFDTLLAMRDARYPYGWIASNGEECSHHYYDVVRIIRLAWPHLDEARRARARIELRRLLDWSLTTNFDLPNGRFKMSFICDPSFEASIEYGLKLWRELGFMGDIANFWSETPLPDAEPSRRALRANGVEVP